MEDKTKQTATRMIGATTAATAMTFGLFMVMEGLVANDELILPEPKNYPKIDPIHVENEVKPIRKSPPLKPLPPLEPTPTPPVPHPGPEDTGPIIGTSLPPIKPTGGAKTTLNIFDGDSDFLPLATQNPVYPNRQQAAGTEGYCMLKFTVTADGLVDEGSIMAVDAMPESAANAFCRASTKAIKKFRYKPRVKNGVAQSVEGVHYKFNFEISD